MTSFAEQYLAEVATIAGELDTAVVDAMAEELARVRAAGGRLFILGVGGGAGNATHAVNDFRKLCDLESYAPTDNVSELSARINDEGWDTAYSAWLARLPPARRGRRAGLLRRRRLARARDQPQPRRGRRAGEGGRREGARHRRQGGRSDRAARRRLPRRPAARPERLTPHVEEFQAVVWHLLVSHPTLARAAGKWESVTERAQTVVAGWAVFLDRDGLVNELVEDSVSGLPSRPPAPRTFVSRRTPSRRSERCAGSACR